MTFQRYRVTGTFVFFDAIVASLIRWVLQARASATVPRLATAFPLYWMT
jgi:hypothetical protein